MPLPPNFDPQHGGMKHPDTNLKTQNTTNSEKIGAKNRTKDNAAVLDHCAEH